MFCIVMYIRICDFCFIQLFAWSCWGGVLRNMVLIHGQTWKTWIRVVPVCLFFENWFGVHFQHTCWNCSSLIIVPFLNYLGGGNSNIFYFHPLPT